MIEVDRLMVEKYHIELIQMMENAGRNLADLAVQRFMGNDVRNKKIIVLAGTGGNGGGVLVCARHLHNWGARVSLVLTGPPAAYADVTAHQLDVLSRMELEVLASDVLYSHAHFDVILDGLIGYSLKGAPRGKAAELIEWANQTGTTILALDTPSGLDLATGKAQIPTIRAAATMTLALPKLGLLEPDAAEFVGELYLADISVPPELYAEAFGIQVSDLFYKNTLLRVQSPDTL
jgi:NAD(P)H-hydrate epimerase